MMSQEFDTNRDGIISGDEEVRAIAFVAELYTDKLSSWGTPLNMGQARLNALDALYKMSANPNEVHSNLVKEIADLKNK